jgi:hypothetical protein
MVSWFMFVGYRDLLWRLCQGWVPVADLGDTHGRWSVLCQWQGKGDPSRPSEPGRQSP